MPSNVGEIVKLCPSCGSYLVRKKRAIIRQGRRSARIYLGCESWPACVYTERLPGDLWMRDLHQPSIV